MMAVHAVFAFHIFIIIIVIGYDERLRAVRLFYDLETWYESV